MASDSQNSRETDPQTRLRAPFLKRLAGFIAGRLVPPEHRHVNWLRDPDIAYFRIGKAANSSIRTLLAQSFDLPQPSGLRPAKNQFWIQQPRVSTLTTAAFVLHPGARNTWSFSFVRHPVARLYSCWNNKVVENEELGAQFLRMGITQNMDFDDFAACVAATPDHQADIHVRSQASILTWRGRVVPSFVGRVESVEADWETVRSSVADRTGVDMGALLKRNVRVGAGLEVADTIAPKTQDLIRRRYAEDFRLFYADL